MGCLASLVLALVCLCPTWTILWLTLRGDLVFNADQPGEVRLWLARNNEGTVLALSTSHRQTSGPSPECRQTQVRFLLLRPELALDAETYCTCLATAGSSTTRPGICPP